MADFVFSQVKNFAGVELPKILDDVNKWAELNKVEIVAISHCCYTQGVFDIIFTVIVVYNTLK